MNGLCLSCCLMAIIWAAGCIACQIAVGQSGSESQMPMAYFCVAIVLSGIAGGSYKREKP